VVTCSDSVSRGSVLDKSGDVIEERLRKHRLSVSARLAIADEREGIHATAKRLIDEGYQLILFTGGTGLSPPLCHAGCHPAPDRAGGAGYHGSGER
jgi:molybdopterin biosynthesis enzyme MoaB